MSNNNGGHFFLTGRHIALDPTEGITMSAPTNMGNIWRTHNLPPRQLASIASPLSNVHLTAHDYHTYHAPVGPTGG